MLSQDEVNLLDYWRVALKWKRLIAAVIVVVTVGTALVSIFLPKIYRAEATLMPVGGPKGAGMALPVGQLGLSSLLGGMLPMSAAPQIMAILNSRTLAERIIEKFDLMKVFFAKSWDEKQQKWNVEDPTKVPTLEDCVRVLASRVTFEEKKKTQLIGIVVELTDPKLAAEIANGYLDELAKYVGENAFTAAKRNRIFVAEQLERNKAELLESGKELSKFYSANKVSNVVPTVNVDVSVGASTQPDGEGSTKLKTKTEELQRKVGEVEGKIKSARVVSDIPQQVYLQYLSFRRELLGQINALLTQQYELAKIDETKEDLNFQVIDVARIPIRKHSPKILQNTAIGFAIALLLGLFCAFFGEYLRKMKALPHSE